MQQSPYEHGKKVGGRRWQKIAPRGSEDAGKALKHLPLRVPGLEPLWISKGFGHTCFE